MIVTADFRVQWEGEGPVERRRRSSALSLLLAPGSLLRLAVDWVRLLGPAGAVLHFVLPP